ncbi:MAG: ImmA/IrrE family metallo-endopeptidase [Peptococcaceae bacterium]|nr:ImmA/IrrE family metallo-endopeptidase [Peptococcaceae bacterium]
MKEKIELNSEAIMLRKHFGEDTMSPLDVFAFLGKLENLTLIFYPFSQRISGMCLKLENDMVIAVNSTLSYGRQRYSAAHELYHLFVQDGFQSTICEQNIEAEKSDSEKEADVFASYFLAPYDSLKSFIQDTLKKRAHTLAAEDVIKIEQYFQMSRQATLFRLLNEGYINKDLAQTMKSGVIKSALKLGYDASLYSPLPENKQYMTTGNYIRLAEQLKDNDLISDGKYEEFLLDAFRSDIVYNLNAIEVERYD